MLSTEDIIAFKSIWKKEYGTDISDEQALEAAKRLINFVGLVLMNKPQGLGEKKQETVEDYPPK